MTLGRMVREPRAGAPRRPDGTFVNYARSVTTSPGAWLEPGSEEELAEHVAGAAAHGRRLRVVGAGHSWSPIAAPRDMGVILARMEGIVGHGPGWVRVKAATRIGDLTRSLSRRGETLPIVGSITEQTVAGAVATATHGSSLQHGNLSGLVLGVRVVTGTGSTLEIGEGDERLDGLRVHLGALGAVTEVTLRTEPAFALAETVELLPVARVRERAQEIGASAEFVKVWWMPHTPTALLFRFERTREPPTRWPSAATQRVIENWLPRAILPAVFARHERRPGGVPAFNRVAARWLARSRRVGPSVLMLTGPYPVRHHETEAAVPLGAAGEAFDRVVSLIDRTGLAVNFILELRYGRGDSSWMSPAYGGDVAYLGACTAMTPQRRTYFDGFWQEMRQLRGRPHWGKEMDHDASEIADLYPMVGRFGALRQDLDPERVFANSFLDRILGT